MQPGKSARGLARPKTLARVLTAHGQREAFWTAAALRRFFITLSNFGFICKSSKGVIRLMPEAKTPWPHAPIRQLAASIDQNHRDGAFDRLDWVGGFLAPRGDRVKALDALQ
jgi:hypothetical protein